MNQRRELGPGEVTRCDWRLGATRDKHGDMVIGVLGRNHQHARGMHKGGAEENKERS